MIEENLKEIKNPRVSIVLTTYNRLSLLERAYTSVLNQSYTNIELIVVDDYSNDGTIEFLRKISDSRVNVILNESSMGVQHNRNAGILISSGYFIVGLDDDDYFHPKRIEYMLANYDNKYSFIGTLIKPINSHKSVGCKEILTLDDILYKNDGFHWPLVEKARLIEVGLFDLNLTALQDHDMWVRLIEKYGPAKILQKEYYFLDTSGSDRITKNYKKKTGGIKKFIEKHHHLMNASQIKYQKYYLKRMEGKQISVPDFLINVPIKYWRKDLRYLLYPIIEKLRNY